MDISARVSRCSAGAEAHLRRTGEIEPGVVRASRGRRSRRNARTLLERRGCAIQCSVATGIEEMVSSWGCDRCWWAATLVGRELADQEKVGGSDVVTGAASAWVGCCYL